jgi:hypothetical protein
MSQSPSFGKSADADELQRADKDYTRVGVETALEYLKDLRPGRYSVDEIFESTKHERHSSPEHYRAAAAQLGWFEHPDTIHVPREPIEKIKAALAAISPDINYTDWFYIGCALHHHLDDEGFWLWEEWSRPSKKYNRREMHLQGKWRECQKISKHKIATVYYHADQADPSWRQRYNESAFSGIADLAEEREKRRSKDAGQLITLDDFVASLTDNSFVFLPTGDHWPAISVNATLKRSNAADWLRENRGVQQKTWDPNKPQLVKDQLILKDSGWIDKPGTWVLNTYQPPKITFGPSNEDAARLWLDLIRKVFPDDWKHIVTFFAHRVQRPGEKINHALFLGGTQGIGKDTILEALRFALGAWNVQEVTPRDIVGTFKVFMRAVVLLVNESHDLGEGKSGNRYSFYETMKLYCAAPPATLLCEPKHVTKFPVINVCGVIMTSNHKTGGIYLPANDRRTYVAWSIIEQKDFSPEFWKEVWSWYSNGGLQAVANFLKAYDLSDFDPKAPPPKTAAFHAIVASNRSPEEGEMSAAIENLGEPKVLTVGMVAQATTSHDFAEWLEDRRNSRIIPHRLEECGYTCVLCPDNERGLWGYYLERAQGNAIVKTRHRVAVYGKRELSEQQRQAEARLLQQQLSLRGDVG